MHARATPRGAASEAPVVVPALKAASVLPSATRLAGNEDGALSAEAEWPDTPASGRTVLVAPGRTVDYSGESTPDAPEAPEDYPTENTAPALPPPHNQPPVPKPRGSVAVKSRGYYNHSGQSLPEGGPEPLAVSQLIEAPPAGVSRLASRVQVQAKTSRGPLESTSSSSSGRSPPRAPPAPPPLPAAPQHPTPQGGGGPNWQGGGASWPAQPQPPGLGRPSSHPQMLQPPPHGARADEFMRAEAATAMRMARVEEEIQRLRSENYGLRRGVLDAAARAQDAQQRAQASEAHAASQQQQAQNGQPQQGEPGSTAAAAASVEKETLELSAAQAALAASEAALKEREAGLAAQQAKLEEEAASLRLAWEEAKRNAAAEAKKAKEAAEKAAREAEAQAGGLAARLAALETSQQEQQQLEVLKQQQEKLHQQQHPQAGAPLPPPPSGPVVPALGVPPHSALNPSNNSSSVSSGPFSGGPMAVVGAMEKLSDTAVLVTVPRLLAEGGFLWKIPFHSVVDPQRRYFQLKPPEDPSQYPPLKDFHFDYGGSLTGASKNQGGNDDDDDDNNAGSLGRLCKCAVALPVTLQWHDPKKRRTKKAPKEMYLDECSGGVSAGHKTPAFWAQAAHRNQKGLPKANLCFSLIAEERTVDLAAESDEEANQWRLALTALVKRLQLPLEEQFKPPNLDRAYLQMKQQQQQQQQQQQALPVPPPPPPPPFPMTGRSSPEAAAAAAAWNPGNITARPLAPPPLLPPPLGARNVPLAVDDEVLWKGADEDLPIGTVGRVTEVHTNDDVEAYFHLATSSQKLFTFSAHRLVVVRRAAAMAQGMRPVAGSADSLVSSDEVMWKSADKDLPAGSVGRVVTTHPDGDVEAVFTVPGRNDMKAYTFAAHRLHLVARPVPVATAILAAAATQSGADPMSLQAVVEASQNGQLGSAEDVKKMVFNAVESADAPALSALLHHALHVLGSMDVMDSASGDTPLMLACRLGHEEMVAICLSYGAKNDPHPSFGQTALQAAVAGGHSACVKALLSEAAPSQADRIIVNHVDPNKQAPLHVSAVLGNLAIIELLLLHGADLRLVDARGGSALHCAVFGGATDCLAYLLDNGGDVLIDEPNLEGCTCLHLTAMHNRLDCARLLLETCADATLLNNQGQNAYRVAISKGRQDIANLLAEFGGTKNGRPAMQPHAPPPAVPPTTRMPLVQPPLPPAQAGAGAMPFPPPPSSRQWHAQTARAGTSNSSFHQPYPSSMGHHHGSFTARPFQHHHSSSVDAIPPFPPYGPANLPEYGPVNRPPLSSSSASSPQSPNRAHSLDPFEAAGHQWRKKEQGGNNNNGQRSDYRDSSSSGFATARDHWRSNNYYDQEGDTGTGQAAVPLTARDRIRSRHLGHPPQPPVSEQQQHHHHHQQAPQDRRRASSVSTLPSSVSSQPSSSFTSFSEFWPQQSDEGEGHSEGDAVSGDYVGNEGGGEEEGEEEQEEAWWLPLAPEEREWYGAVGEGAFYFTATNEVWDVQESEGYPYYVEVASGHSQWEDPRTVDAWNEEEEDNGEYVANEVDFDSESAHIHEEGTPFGEQGDQDGVFEGETKEDTPTLGRKHSRRGSGGRGKHRNESASPLASTSGARRGPPPILIDVPGNSRHSSHNNGGRSSGSRSPVKGGRPSNTHSPSSERRNHGLEAGDRHTSANQSSHGHSSPSHAHSSNRSSSSGGSDAHSAGVERGHGLPADGALSPGYVASLAADVLAGRGATSGGAPSSNRAAAVDDNVVASSEAKAETAASSSRDPKADSGDVKSDKSPQVAREESSLDMPAEAKQDAQAEESSSVTSGMKSSAEIPAADHARTADSAPDPRSALMAALQARQGNGESMSVKKAEPKREAIHEDHKSDSAAAASSTKTAAVAPGPAKKMTMGPPPSIPPPPSALLAKQANGDTGAGEAGNSDPRAALMGMLAARNASNGSTVAPRKDDPPPQKSERKVDAKPESKGHEEGAAEKAAKTTSTAPKEKKKKKKTSSKDTAIAAAGPLVLPVVETKDALREDPVLAKYVKMAAMGVPAPAVRNKMTAEGVATGEARRFELCFGLVTPEEAAKADAKASGNGGGDDDDDDSSDDGSESESEDEEEGEDGGADDDVPLVDKAVLREDPQLGKFVKMASMGVPPASVVHKMTLEGVDMQQLAIFKKAHGLPVTPRPKKKKKEPKPGKDGKKKKGKKDKAAKANLINVHWEALSTESVAGTVWGGGLNDEGGSSDGVAPVSLGADHLETLQAIFSAAPPAGAAAGFLRRGSIAGGGGNGSGGGAGNGGKGGNAALAGAPLLDAKRANNMAIALAQFKAFAGDTPAQTPTSATSTARAATLPTSSSSSSLSSPSFRYKALCVAVLEQDDRDLTADNLEALAELMPTAEEARKLQSFRGDPASLGPAEAFAYACTRFPRLPQRLQVFATKLHLPASRSALGERCACVRTAAEDIMASKGLALVLRQMLVIGNIMNEGKKGGQASGITLDSLLKLVATKGADKKTTVLDYVVNLCLDKGHAPLLEFPGEFKSLEAAARTPSREVERDLQGLEQRVRMLDKEAAIAQREAQEATSNTDSADSTAAPAAGAGAGASGASSSSSSAAIDPLLLAAYASRVATLADTARPQVEAATADVSSMSSAVAKLAGYFGEDARVCGSEKLFGAMKQFIESFKQSRAKVDRQRMAAERQKAARRAEPKGGIGADSSSGAKVVSPRAQAKNAAKAISRRRLSVAGADSSESDNSDASWDEERPSKAKAEDK